MWKLIKDSAGEIRTIELTAGDTPSFKINCNVKSPDGEVVEYIPEEGDVFIFACKKNKADKDYLFKIEIPNDTMILRFKESDTKDLPIGNYIWEVSLNKPAEDYHCTFICEKVLKITTEVY